MAAANYIITTNTSKAEAYLADVSKRIAEGETFDLKEVKAYALQLVEVTVKPE